MKARYLKEQLETLLGGADIFLDLTTSKIWASFFNTFATAMSSSSSSPPM